MSYTPFIDGESPAHEAINTRLQELQNGITIKQTALQSGTITFYPAASPPAGYLSCDGSPVSRNTYAALFAVIGTTYGVGDGSTTFNLPDLRGRTPIGVGQGSGLTNRVLGVSLGEEAHQLTVNELPVHQHPNTSKPAAGSAGPTAGAVAIPTAGNTGSAGNDVPHNNMQPFLVVNFIIKT